MSNVKLRDQSRLNIYARQNASVFNNILFAADFMNRFELYIFLTFKVLYSFYKKIIFKQVSTWFKNSFSKFRVTMFYFWYCYNIAPEHQAATPIWQVSKLKTELSMFDTHTTTSYVSYSYIQIYLLAAYRNAFIGLQ